MVFKIQLLTSLIALRNLFLRHLVYFLLVLFGFFLMRKKHFVFGKPLTLMQIVNNITIKVIIESKLGYLLLIRKIIRGICSNVIQDEKIF